MCNNHVWRTLTADVHPLNLELFQRCKNIKEKKFRRQPKPDISENTVVKIPDTVPLSKEETSILQKGLSFIPERKTVDRFDTLSDKMIIIMNKIIASSQKSQNMKRADLHLLHLLANIELLIRSSIHVCNK